MELFRVGEVIRKPPRQLLPLLTQSIRPKVSRAIVKVQCKPLSTSSQHREEGTTLQRPGIDRQSSSDAFPSTAPSSQSSIADEISSLLDTTLDHTKGTPTTSTSRSSRFSSRNAQSRQSPSRALANDGAARPAENKSSIEALLSSMLSGASGPDGQGANDFDFSRPPETEKRPPMKLSSSTGRTIHLDASRNMDVGKAFRQLEMLCSRNRVRKDLMMQRFHERPGLKRKRLKRERWRARFKKNFQGMVNLVQTMKRQGW